MGGGPEQWPGAQLGALAERPGTPLPRGFHGRKWRGLEKSLLREKGGAVKRTRRGPGGVGVAKGREGQRQVCADLGVGDPNILLGPEGQRGSLSERNAASRIWGRAGAGGLPKAASPAGGQTEGQPTPPTGATFGAPSSRGLWSWSQFWHLLTRLLTIMSTCECRERGCLIAKLCLCPTLCYLLSYSPPGSSVWGSSQARILEWVAISFSRGSAQLRDRTHVFCVGRWIVYHSVTREA